MGEPESLVDLDVVRAQRAARRAELRHGRASRRAELARLLRDQHGMVARRQLNALGITWETAEADIVGRRWVERTPRVISTVTGELTRAQRQWLGVLHAGPGSLLGCLTAAERLSLKGWERDEVTVLVDDELSYDPVNGIRFFRSRRPFALMAAPRPGIPTARLEPAILLWAGYQAPNLKTAEGVLAAAVQQRLTTAQKLFEEVEAMRPLRRAAHFRAVLSVIDKGAHSSAEINVERMCRLFAMPPPDRQTERQTPDGRRWTDCEWDLPAGGVVILEVEGPVHLQPLQSEHDMRRQRRLTSPGERFVVRCSDRELRQEPHEVAVDLMAYGIPGSIPRPAA